MKTSRVIRSLFFRLPALGFFALFLATAYWLLPSAVLASDWQLGLTISVPFVDGEGGKATQVLTSGARLTALDGYDNTWDTVTLNSSTAMVAYFYHPEFAPDLQLLARDFRFDSYPQQWDFYVSSDQNGQPVTMALSSPYPALGSCLGMTLSLMDVTAGTPVDLTQSAYVYTNNAAVTRHFQLTATQTVETPPSAPANLFSPRTGTTSVLLAWTGSLPANGGYYVYRKDPDTAAYHRVTTTLLSVAKYLDSGLLPGSYSYLVTTATTTGCESGPSNGVTVTVGP